MPLGTTSTERRNGLDASETRASRAAAEGVVVTSHRQYVPRLYHHATRKKNETKNFEGTLARISLKFVWNVPTSGRR